MLKHEKKAFFEFFSIYFGSVALLVLAAGHFYYIEQKQEFLKGENFKMIDYARMFKTKTPVQNTDISHIIKKIDMPNFNISNFEIQKDYFIKYVPHNWVDEYMIIKKRKGKYNQSIHELIKDIVFYQIFLLLIFATISYFLSRMALRPMREAVTRLDNFSKDLIHDINTPITSILLNMKLLKKDEHFSENKYLERISQNVKDIHSLNSNLTILLSENSLNLEKVDIFKVISDVINTYQKEYPQIKFELSSNVYFTNINENAFKQIILNLMSNATKYSKQPTTISSPYIKIYMASDILFIEDNGLGIKNPVNVFDRNYTEHELGHGIGLDIVKRLCEAMNIDISVSSKENEGSIFSLKFNNII